MFGVPRRGDVRGGSDRQTEAERGTGREGWTENEGNKSGENCLQLTIRTTLPWAFAGEKERDHERVDFFWAKCGYCSVDSGH